MSSDWITTTIGALADVYDGPHATPEKTADGPVFLGISNLVGGRLDLTEVEHLSEDAFAKWTRRVTPRKNDVVFSYETRLGEAALIPDGLRCCLGRRMGLLRCKEGVDPRFLLYYFLGPSFQAVIQERTIHGSTVDRIPLVDLPSFPVRIPLLAEQQRIARLLGTLDDKIEVNRRMNDTLEAMARSLFKSWFIDFDPVQAKAEGRQPFGMHIATAAMFPSALEESVLGPVPRDWSVVPLGDVMELKRGYDLPTSTRQSGSVPIISSSGPSGFHSDAKVSGPGVVTGRYGTIGNVYWVWEDFWPLNTALYVRDFKGTDALVAYHILRNLDFDKFSDKAAVPGVNRNHVHQEPVCLPPQQLQRRFRDIASVWLERRRANDEEIRTLARIRRLLLPRLFDRGLLTTDLEQATEAVA